MVMSSWTDLVKHRKELQIQVSRVKIKLPGCKEGSGLGWLLSNEITTPVHWLTKNCMPYPDPLKDPKNGTPPI